jgi:aspartate aminotransferase-like enzyme
MEQKLMTPGPINVPAISKNRLSKDPPYFAGQDFSRLLGYIQPPLQYIFGTEEPVMIGTGSGTLAMESVLSNFFEWGNQIVIFNMGKYGTNWALMAREYHDVIVHEIDVTDDKHWSDHIRTLRKFLENYPIKGVFITHCETTTALVAPLHLIRMVTRSRSPETLVIVDAISTLAVTPIKARNFDVVIGCSQKGLQLPPGLFFLTASEYAMKVAELCSRSSFYFDVIIERKRTMKNETSHTPASYLFKALLHTVLSIESKGLSQLYTHCLSLRRSCKIMLEYAEIPIFRESPVCTVVKTDKANEILKRLLEKNWVFGGGIREDRGKLIRIMHFGWATQPSFIEAGMREFIKVYKEVHNG